MQQGKRIIPVILFCLYLTAVAFLCFAKPEDMPQLPALWLGIPADKVGHFAMFLPFPFLAYLIFDNNDMNFIRKSCLLAVILCFGAGMAIGTEQIQAILAYRDASMDDFIADMAGMGTGCIITILYILFKNKR